MCLATATPTKPTTPPSSSSSSSNKQTSENPTNNVVSTIINKVWPLPSYVAVLVLAIFVPQSCYINRGFTQWFHWMSIYYGLTQSTFIERFQILSGFSICLGWYSSLVYEFLQHKRFCHPLYKNMPSIMVQYMMLVEDDNQNLDFVSTTSLLVMGLSHILDLLAHPLLTYYFWYRHMKRHQNENKEKIGLYKKAIRQILTVDVIVAAYMYSRVWSLTHTKYNTGRFGLWYMGFDVYVMDTLDSWYPAYIVEGIVYSSVALWKVYDVIIINNNDDNTKQEEDFGPCNTTTTIPSSQDGCDRFEKKPSLLWSESTISMDSRASVSSGRC